MKLKRFLPRVAVFPSLSVFAIAASWGCGSSPGPLDSRTALHLEDHLETAEIESAGPSTGALREIEWKFDEPRPEWKPVAIPGRSGIRYSTELVSIDGALKLSLLEVGRAGMLIIGGLYTELDDWDFDDWEAIVLRARTSDPVWGMMIGFEFEAGVMPKDMVGHLAGMVEATPVFSDGELQTYVFPVTRPESKGPESEGKDEPWKHLGIAVGALEEASFEIVSISAVPSGGAFRDPYGVKSVARENSVRRTLFAHTPARLSYRVNVPSGGRLDLELGVVRSDVAVDFKVSAEADGAVLQTLFEQSHSDAAAWRPVSVDLSSYVGQPVTLSLEADAEREGTVALWAAPTLGGDYRSDKPNVIFYVIDGAGADYMSVYGYNRRTTPNMERLAAEGAVFERAFSNSTWTQPSTASFMTSLQHSVLGGLNRGVYSSPIPPSAKTMAEHLHDAGYLTSSFTTNPNAGLLIGIERGMDALFEHLGGHHSVSSKDLQQDFWTFREQYPVEPYWAHFQTTDVHWPYRPVPPFAGLYVSPEQSAELSEWEGKMFSKQLELTSIFAAYRAALERESIPRQTFYERHRGLYDETMAHQDYQLGRLVDRLKASGEWERTLLIIAADHGHPAGSYSRFGRGMLEEEPPDWEGALLGSFNSRIPLIFVWPGRIEGGRRFTEPVSMIDVLPTVLDLVGLPQPEVLQGQSLVPLLRGQPGWEPHPVIFDEFRVDTETGEWFGNIEMVDGRWGASLEVSPVKEGADPNFGRHAIPAGGRWGATHPYFDEAPRLLLYDLFSDPYALHNVNERYPELVDKYRERLQAQWEAHQALATQFQAGEDVPLSPDQLQQLRSLGYVQ